MVFQILYNKFYAKFSKCDFLMKDINFLSHIMYKKAVSVDPANIQTILVWHTPKIEIDIWSFLGLACYSFKKIGTIRFGFYGKLKTQYKGPFDIITRIEDLTQEFTLPPSLDKVHNILNISMLKKYVWDECHIISDYRELNIQPDVTHEMQLVRILNKENKVLRKKTISLVKVA